MKRLTCFAVLLVFCLSIFAISVNPSMDGRAVVADEGVFPPGGYYGRAPGYLPGDTVVVTNHNNGFSIDVLILGTYDAYEGIAILLSPEAADKLQIVKGKDVYVKVQKKQPMSYEEAVATSKNKKANQVIDTDKDSSVLPGETEQLVNDVIASKNNSEISQVEVLPVEQEIVNEIAETESTESEYVAEEETSVPEEVVEVTEIPQEAVEQEITNEVAEVEATEPEYVAEEETSVPEEVTEVTEIPQEELVELAEPEEYVESESIDSPVFEVVEEVPEVEQEIEVAEELPEENEDEVVLDDIQNEDFDETDLIDSPVESEIVEVIEEELLPVEEVVAEEVPVVEPEQEIEVAEELPEENEDEVVLDDIQNEDFDESDFIDTPVESEIAEVPEEEILPVEEIVVEEIPEEIAELEESTEEFIEDDEEIVLDDILSEDEEIIIAEEEILPEEVVAPVEEVAELPTVETVEEVILEEEIEEVLLPEEEVAEIVTEEEIISPEVLATETLEEEPELALLDDYVEEPLKSATENPKDIFSMIVGEELEDEIIEDVVLEEAEPKLPELDDSYLEETAEADIEIKLDEPEVKLSEIIEETKPIAIVKEEIKFAKDEFKNEEFANTVADFKDLPKVKNAKSSTYYIQIATVNKKENVAKMIDLHGKKYPVYVIKNPAKSSYQILVGPLNDDEYALVLARFKQTYKDAFLRVAK